MIPLDRDAVGSVCHYIHLNPVRAKLVDCLTQPLVKSSVKVELETWSEMNEIRGMNRTELAATVDELTADERSYLSAYLKMKERISDTTYAREMSTRLKTMQSGYAVQRDEVLDLHSRLSKSGL